MSKVCSNIVFYKKIAIPSSMLKFITSALFISFLFSEISLAENIFVFDFTEEEFKS